MHLFRFNGSTALGLALALTACQADPDQRAEPFARNVVVFCVDTLRVDHLGTYGYARDTSPNIDALGKQGVVFEDAIALAPWTLPSTATILSGLEPWQHGAELQGQTRNLDRDAPLGLRPGVRTLAELARARGFRTAMLSPNPFMEAIAAGFDFLWTEKQAPAEALVSRALGWIREKPRRRFFLYFQFMDLHQPLQPPEPYFNYFSVDEGGRRGPEHGDWLLFRRLEQPASPEFARYRAHKIGLYDGALKYVDAQIGAFVSELQRLGLEKETLFVVTADHGEELWDHAEVERRLSGDPREIWGIGHGHSLFQELLRVPLVVAGPRVARGRRVDCAVSLMDLAPSVLEVLGRKTPRRMRGRSLMPWLGPVASPCLPGPRIAGSVAFGPESWAVLNDGEKLIVRSDGVELLYDLRIDPLERHDLAREKPQQVARLKSLLGKETKNAQVERSPVAMSPELLERLQALGYLGN